MAVALGVVLLAVAVAGLVSLRPLGVLAPPALAAVAVASGLLDPAAALHAVRPLLAPLAFVLLAVPLAVLLDELGFFEELADLVGASRRYLGACWAMAALVTALLNLDAAVVMLTPLYLRLAERRGTAPIVLCVQPLLLSCLASSALPISNLTNLVAAPSAGLTAWGFLVHLGVPTVATTSVGWLAYRRLPLHGDGVAAAGAAVRPPAAAGTSRGRQPQRGAGRRPPAAGGASRRRVLVVGGLLVAACVAGFLAVPSFGGSPWEVAAGGDLVLAALVRRLPLGVVPWKSVATVLGLGVLAAALARHLTLGSVLGGEALPDLLRDVGLMALASNAVNNLPALLAVLPHVGSGRGWTPWAVLLGANVAPLALPSGTLASLLWLETVRRLGLDFGERRYLATIWRVALPALLAGVAVLVAWRLLLGAGR